MKLLLDTHIWIWAQGDRRRLTARVRRALESAEHDLWLSPVSVWEFFLLAERGRVRVADPSRWVQLALAQLAVRDAPLTREVALESRLVDLGHPDPADRFLAATAIVYELTLVTADERLLASKRVQTLPNR